MVVCYLVSQILPTLPGYHYSLSGEGEADAISVSSKKSREYPHSTAKGKRKEADHVSYPKMRGLDIDIGVEEKKGIIICIF